MPPAFIGIAADINARSKKLAPILSVADTNVEVQDEIADLLYPSNQGLISTELIGCPSSASIATMEIASGLNGEVLVQRRIHMIQEPLH